MKKKREKLAEIKEKLEEIEEICNEIKQPSFFFWFSYSNTKKKKEECQKSLKKYKEEYQHWEKKLEEINLSYLLKKEEDIKKITGEMEKSVFLLQARELQP